MNLLANAIDALEEHKTHQMPATICIQTQALNPQWIRICIVDNGPGILAFVLQRLFGPFFTTKEIGKEIGLGLSISYQIVTEKHGGHLYCNSVVGKGTEFVIEIPARQP